MARKRLNYPGTAVAAPLERVYVQCAHDGCRECAIVNQRTITGWAKLCETHYDAYWLGVAKGEIQEYQKSLDKSCRADWYAQRGLPYEPPRKLRGNMDTWTMLHGKMPKITRQREPGDDDEEIVL